MPCTCKFVVLNPCGLFIGSILCDGVFAGRKSASIASIESLTSGIGTRPCGAFAGGLDGSRLMIRKLKVSPGRVSIVGPTVRPLYVRVRSLYPLMLVSAYCAVIS